MEFRDTLVLDGPRRTADGYFAVRARAARTGVQDYLGFEVDPEGIHFKADERVAVYRPPEEVFARDAVASFLMKPITNEHPKVAVTATNWRDHARGVVAQVLRDGEHLAFDLVLMDAAAIADVDAGKRELSGGYNCSIEIGDGVAPDGKPYQATQRTIRGNHVAVVRNARGGPELRIGDTAVCDAIPQLLENLNLTTDGVVPMKTLTIDGLKVPNVSDEAESAITKLQGQVKDAADASARLFADHSAVIASKDAEIAKRDAELDALKGKVLDETALDARVAARADLIAAAKAVAPELKTDGVADADIRRAAVVAVLGDAAVTDKAQAYVDARFDILAEDAAKGAGLRSAVGNVRTIGASGGATLADAAYRKANEDLNAWRAA